MATKELFPINTSSSVKSFSSRFNHHNIYRDENQNTFLQTWNPRVLPPKESDKTFVVPASMAYRIDLVSDAMYGTPLLSWAICYVNDIMNPLDRTDGLYPGRLIRIPDPSTIYGGV